VFRRERLVERLLRRQAGVHLQAGERQQRLRPRPRVVRDRAGDLQRARHVSRLRSLYCEFPEEQRAPPFRHRKRHPPLLADNPDVRGGLQRLVERCVRSGLHTGGGLGARDGVKRLGALQRVFPTVRKLQRLAECRFGLLRVRGARLRHRDLPQYRDAHKQPVWNLHGKLHSLVDLPGLRPSLSDCGDDRFAPVRPVQQVHQSRRFVENTSTVRRLKTILP
jgi:hypothetical protein